MLAVLWRAFPNEFWTGQRHTDDLDKRLGQTKDRHTTPACHVYANAEHLNGSEGCAGMFMTNIAWTGKTGLPKSTKNGRAILQSSISMRVAKGDCS